MVKALLSRGHPELQVSIPWLLDIGNFLFYNFRGLLLPGLMLTPLLLLQVSSLSVTYAIIKKKKLVLLISIRFYIYID